MANRTFKGVTIKIDNASGALTEITSSVNQASIESVLEMLEDTSLADDERTYDAGLAGATAPLNGFVNSTTEPIFGPLLGQRTSITKTLQIYNGLKYFTGEVWCNNVQWSGNAGELQTWSIETTFDGGITRTSVGS